MDKKEILNEIDKKFNRLKIFLSEKDIGEKIHSLRVGFKKARALLHILQLSDKKNIELAIAKPMQKWYHTAGDCRNMELTIKIITELSVVHKKQIEKFKEEEKRLCRKAEELLPSGDLIDVAKEKLKSSIHRDLKESNIKNFVKNGKSKIRENMRFLNDDEHLHNIRKILKDFSYNKKIIESVLPVFFEKLPEKKFDEILLMLGRNQDLRVVLENINKYDRKENQSSFNKAKKIILQEKKILKSDIKKELDWLSEEVLM